MPAPTNIVLQTLTDGATRRFVLYSYAPGSDAALIGHIDSSAGDYYGGEAVPVSVGNTCFVFGLGSVAAKILDGAVTTVADPMPAVESGASGAAAFQHFVTAEGVYLVRGWYHAGRDESYKVIYRVGEEGAVFAYQTSNSFNVPDVWTATSGSDTKLLVVGAIDSGELWLRTQSAWGTSSPDYAYQSLDLTTGAIATIAPSGVVFPDPYDNMANALVWDYNYTWGVIGEGGDVILSGSASTQHTALLLGDAEFDSGGYNEGSWFRVYPTTNRWATSSDGHGEPAIEYTDLTYTASGFYKHSENYVLAALGSALGSAPSSEPPSSWWKNKIGVLEVLE